MGMALVFRRRLALPVWWIVFLTVALAPSPPARRVLMVIVGVALIAFISRILARRLGSFSSIVPAVSPRQRDRTTAALSMDGGTSVRTLDELDMNPPAEPPGADEPIELVRGDQDGSWQMRRPRLSLPADSASS